MTRIHARVRFGALLSACVLAAAVLAPVRGAMAAEAPEIRMELDASDAARQVFRASVSIDAKPGALTLVYPKWIPGEHGPTGPLGAVGGLHFFAGGKEIAWRRDLEDMYAFHLTVPEGASMVTVKLTYNPSSNDNRVFSAGRDSTSNLAVISWNHFVLYPVGKPASAQTVQATIKLPKGWTSAGSLAVASASKSGEVWTYKPTTLEMLVDHPILAGKHIRKIDLSPEGAAGAPHHEIDLLGETASAVAADEETIGHWRHLVAEAAELFGSRHYDNYHFLLTLSDQLGHFGLEHHECSDDRTGATSLTESKGGHGVTGLLSHEYVHSWNGKYRRPVGLATPDYQVAMKDDLLWVYEGLTEYYGEVLEARCGAIGAKEFRDSIAGTLAFMQLREGRTWRSLQDTCDASPFLYQAGESSHLRGTDFYPEGTLIWLDADTHIRKLTGNQKSLDDFCRLFYGAADPAAAVDAKSLKGTGPAVRPYTEDEIFATLNQVVQADWRGFFKARLNSTERNAPMGGITAAGYKLTYSDSPNLADDSDSPSPAEFALGVSISKEGDIRDAVRDYPGFKGGLSPGMTIVAVNGQKYSNELLTEIIKGTKETPAEIEFLVRQNDFFSTVKLMCNTGLQYPHLTRIDGTEDLLEKITAARTAAPTTMPAEK